MAALDASDGQQSQAVCSICLIQLSRYTCPRCNVRYCSLACYRHEKHLQCSESFYRESVIAELQQMKGSGEERRHVMEMLMRIQKGDEEGDDVQCEDHVESLEFRVAGLDLDKDLDEVWQRLTPSEQQQFNQLVQSGHIGHLFSLNPPWWEASPLVVVDIQDQRSSSHRPPVLSGLSPLSSLGATVSPCVCYSILNVLYAYAYIVRLYNGDHLELAVQASQVVLDISGTLSSNALFKTTRDALHGAITVVQQSKDLYTSFESSVSAVRDVGNILCHPTTHCSQVLEALSDLHGVLSRARAAAKAGKSPDSQDLVRQLHRVVKKVYFFVVWSKEHTEELASMSSIVHLEYEASLKELQAYQETEQKVKAFRAPCNAGSSSHHCTVPQALIEQLN